MAARSFAADTSPVLPAPARAPAEHDYADLRERLIIAVRRVVPSWLADQTEDLVQMSMVRILRSYAEVELNTSFLYRVAHSVVVDEIRRRRRRQEVGITPSLPDTLEHRGEPGPEGHARGAQLGEHVVSCLAALSVERRRVVTLHLMGHNSVEIASLLGIEKKQAENLAYRGLKELRVALADRGVTP